MDCTEIRKRLGLDLDGMSSAEDRSAIETHLRTCDACRKERASLRRLADELATRDESDVPVDLWPSIEAKLERTARSAPQATARTSGFYVRRRPMAAAAALLLVIGLAGAGVVWLGSTESTARADTIDFGVLLDSLSSDARGAFDAFLNQYGAREIPAAEAHDHAADLDFETPETLPGGFLRQNVYLLRFGSAAGIAVSYIREDGEFLAALFHRPVLQEAYGTHKDYPCVIGHHRGHTVEVGAWRLVHLTDPTTCHCVLSRLDPENELPDVLSAVAPRSQPTEGHGHSHHGD